jgi:hypothetical protein
MTPHDASGTTARRDRPVDVLSKELGSDAVAERALRALSAAGYVCVPREPTPRMIDAGWADAHEEDAAGTWRAMVEADEPTEPTAETPEQ